MPRRHSDTPENSDMPSPTAPTAPAGEAGEQRIPLIAEQLRVERRPVETGRVRVVKTVREEEAQIDAPVFAEQVTVERVPVGRIVDEPVPVRTEGDTVIVPVLEEVPVVVMRYLLKEEIHVRKRRTMTPSSRTVTRRVEEARVERVGPGGTASAPGGADEQSDEV